MASATGLVLIAMGVFGAFLHVRSSLVKGRWVGTHSEIEFFVGSLMALSCLPMGLVMLAF